MIKTLLFDFGNVVAFFDHDRAVRRLLPHTDLTAEQFGSSSIRTTWNIATNAAR